MTRMIELAIVGRKRAWWRADVRYAYPCVIGVFTLLAPGTRTLLSRNGPVRVRLPWTAVSLVRDVRRVAFFDAEPRGEGVARRVRYHSLAVDDDVYRTFNVCCGGYGDFWNTTFKASAPMLRRHLVDDARFIVSVRELRDELLVVDAERREGSA